MTESEVMLEISAYIRVKGLMIYRTNTGRRGGVSYGIKGSGDFTGLLPSGQYIAIEAKGEGGKQSQDQKNFQERVLKNNGIYILAFSLEDIKNGLTDLEK